MKMSARIIAWLVLTDLPLNSVGAYSPGSSKSLRRTPFCECVSSEYRANLPNIEMEVSSAPPISSARDEAIAHRDPAPTIPETLVLEEATTPVSIRACQMGRVTFATSKELSDHGKIISLLHPTQWPTLSPAQPRVYLAVEH